MRSSINGNYRESFIDTFFRWLPRKKKALVIAAINNKYSVPLRLNIAEQWPDLVDIFGGGWPKNMRNHRGFTASKVDLFKRYRYSLVLENQHQPGYITEKIMGCIGGGAVPPYWGAPDIHEFPGLDWVPLLGEHSARIGQIMADDKLNRQYRKKMTEDFDLVMNEFSSKKFIKILGV